MKKRLPTLDDVKSSACAKRPENVKVFEEFVQKRKDSGKKTSKNGRIVSKHFKKKSKEKDYIAWNLLYWCNQKAVILEEEYSFHPERNWRFDWCIPSLKIAIEYEGIFSEKSRHTTASGFSGDSEKYNEAQALGWKVLRFTALTYTTLLKQLNQSYASKVYH